MEGSNQNNSNHTKQQTQHNNALGGASRRTVGRQSPRMDFGQEQYAHPMMVRSLQVASYQSAVGNGGVLSPSAYRYGDLRGVNSGAQAGLQHEPTNEDRPRDPFPGLFADITRLRSTEDARAQYLKTVEEERSARLSALEEERSDDLKALEEECAARRKALDEKFTARRKLLNEDFNTRRASSAAPDPLDQACGRRPGPESVEMRSGQFPPEQPRVKPHRHAAPPRPMPPGGVLWGQNLDRGVRANASIEEDVGHGARDEDDEEPEPKRRRHDICGQMQQDDRQHHYRHSQPSDPVGIAIDLSDDSGDSDAEAEGYRALWNVRSHMRETDSRPLSTANQIRSKTQTKTQTHTVDEALALLDILDRNEQVIPASTLPMRLKNAFSLHLVKATQDDKNFRVLSSKAQIDGCVQTKVRRDGGSGETLSTKHACTACAKQNRLCIHKPKGTYRGCIVPRCLDSRGDAAWDEPSFWFSPDLA